jgi:pimeloyl-ACP methyl ester carboxylesterase
MAETGFLDVGGGRLYYEVEGEGHPLTLIHAGIANLRMWDAQMPAFAERHRVIRYDTRGFGRTETANVPFSNRADVAALLDHLGVSSTYLLGISRAGSIALDFTLERPERVDALIFVAGGIGGYTSPEGPPESVFEEAERLYEARDWEALADWETRYWVDGPGQPTDRVDPGLRARVHDWILTNYQAEKEEGQPQVLDPPAAGRLAEVRVPVLAISGDLDEPGTAERCRHLADSVPDGRFELIPGTAHMVNMEQPERFNRLVLDFLAEVEARISSRA